MEFRNQTHWDMVTTGARVMEGPTGARDMEGPTGARDMEAMEARVLGVFMAPRPTARQRVTAHQAMAFLELRVLRAAVPFLLAFQCVATSPSLALASATLTAHRKAIAALTTRSSAEC